MKTTKSTTTINLTGKKQMISRFIITTMLMLGLSVTERVLAQPAYDDAAVIPSWAPSYDHSQESRYYYLPDLLIFYDVYTSQFISQNGGYWYGSYTLPAQYSGYNLNNAYVVVLNEHAKKPWKYFKKYNAYYPGNYYCRFEDRSICGYDENSKAFIYEPDFRNESRRDAVLRDNYQQHTVHDYTSNDRRTSLSLLIDKSNDKRNDDKKDNNLHGIRR